MSIWYRVFGSNDMEPDLEELGHHLEESGFLIPGQPRGDDQGWFQLDLILDEKSSPVIVERFKTSEEGVRQELNHWAAWLETCDYSPNHLSLMEQVIGTKQIFSIRRPLDHADEARLDNLCSVLTRFFAEKTEGLIQIDGQGFFNTREELLLQEY